MATGRTLDRFSRVYISGYDFSGHLRKTGDTGVDAGAVDLSAITDPVKNVLCDQPIPKLGDINVLFDNTATTGAHTVASTLVGSPQLVTIARGIRAIPAMGDPVFEGKFLLKDYVAQVDGGAVAATLKFGDWDEASLIDYSNLWGVLLHAKSAETAVNTAAGLGLEADPETLGGFICYHCFTSNGTVTLKVQHAETNTDGSFADLTGATSGSIDATSAPKSGIVALGLLTAVKPFTRWQLVLGTASTATFVLTFHRTNIPPIED